MRAEIYLEEAFPHPLFQLWQHKPHDGEQRTTWTSPREDATGRLLSDERELLGKLSDGVGGGSSNGGGGGDRTVCVVVCMFVSGVVRLERGGVVSEGPTEISVLLSEGRSGIFPASASRMTRCNNAPSL